MEFLYLTSFAYCGHGHGGLVHGHPLSAPCQLCYQVLETILASTLEMP